MRSLKVLGLVIVVVALIAIGAAIGGAINIRWNNNFSISPVDLLTVILTAISLLLTLLTIFLAVFGFIGWTSINDRLREHSLEYMKNELQEGQPTFLLIRKAVQDAVYEGISPIDSDQPFEDSSSKQD